METAKKEAVLLAAQTEVLKHLEKELEASELSVEIGNAVVALVLKRQKLDTSVFIMACAWLTDGILEEVAELLEARAGARDASQRIGWSN